MRRIATTLVGVVGGFLLFAGDALAGPFPDGYGRSATSFSAPSQTVGLWAAIGVGIVLTVAWLVYEGQKHEWHPPHRPVRTH